MPCTGPPPESDDPPYFPWFPPLPFPLPIPIPIPGFPPFLTPPFPGQEDPTGGESGDEGGDGDDGEDNYATKDGVDLPPEVEEKVEEIADAYNEKTDGETITVTSGTREPAEQAEAMFKNRHYHNEDFTKVYKDWDSAKEIQDAYDEAIGKKSHQEVIDDMTEVIKKQVDDGTYISEHLKDGAVDIKSLDMTADQKEKFKEAAEEAGASYIHHKHHWHLELD